MKKITSWFKNQNLIIKIGFVSLAISILFLIIGLILILTANFIPGASGDPTSNGAYSGNGFNVIGTNGGIIQFLTNSGIKFIRGTYYGMRFTSYPVYQVTAGIIFAVILVSISGGIAVLSLFAGYFKRWLYS